MDGLRALNAPQHIIDENARKVEESGSEDCEVWPENEGTVQFFLDISSQWIVSGMGDYIGLDHQAIYSTMDMVGIHRKNRTKRATLFRHMKVMEASALEVIEERKKE